MRKRHGYSQTKLYKKWKYMKKRCNNPNDKRYKHYGGKGIKVCEEWANDFMVFREWAYQNGYEEGLTIERKDNNLGYSPDNCRWITMAEQAKNTSQNIFITRNGETKILSDWCRELGLNVRTIMWRYEQGISGEELFAPKKVTMKGKHHSEETKRRLSEAMKGNTHARKKVVMPA
jgi:hypothetical protein